MHSGDHVGVARPGGIIDERTDVFENGGGSLMAGRKLARPVEVEIEHGVEYDGHRGSGGIAKYTEAQLAELVECRNAEQRKQSISGLRQKAFDLDAEMGEKYKELRRAYPDIEKLKKRDPRAALALAGDLAEKIVNLGRELIPFEKLETSNGAAYVDREDPHSKELNEYHSQLETEALMQQPVPRDHQGGGGGTKTVLSNRAVCRKCGLVRRRSRYSPRKCECAEPEFVTGYQRQTMGARPVGGGGQKSRGGKKSLKGGTAYGKGIVAAAGGALTEKERAEQGLLENSERLNNRQHDARLITIEDRRREKRLYARATEDTATVILAIEAETGINLASLIAGIANLRQSQDAGSQYALKAILAAAPIDKRKTA